MKNKLFHFVVIFLLITIPYIASAQILGPSNPGSEPQGQPIGGSAPVGGGLFILIGLGAAYAGKKVVELNKKQVDHIN